MKFNFNTIRQLLIEDQHVDSIAYKLMSDNQKLDEYSCIIFTIPSNLSIQVKNDKEWLTVDRFEIHRIVDEERDIESTVLIVHSINYKDDPDTFGLDDNLEVKIFQQIEL